MNEIREIGVELRGLGGIMPTVLQDLERYHDNHRFLLILSCAFAELLVSVLIADRCKHAAEINDRHRDYPLSVQLTLLHELNIIPDEYYTWLNWLRTRRNEAAHTATFKFTKERLPAWGGPDHQTPDKLFSLCVNILAIFWNSHVELFREKLPLGA